MKTLNPEQLLLKFFRASQWVMGRFGWFLGSLATLNLLAIDGHVDPHLPFLNQLVIPSMFLVIGLQIGQAIVEAILRRLRTDKKPTAVDAAYLTVFIFAAFVHNGMRYIFLLAGLLFAVETIKLTHKMYKQRTARRLAA